MSALLSLCGEILTTTGNLFTTKFSLDDRLSWLKCQTRKGTRLVKQYIILAKEFIIETYAYTTETTFNCCKRIFLNSPVVWESFFTRCFMRPCYFLSESGIHDAHIFLFAFIVLNLFYYYFIIKFSLFFFRFSVKRMNLSVFLLHPLKFKTYIFGVHIYCYDDWNEKLSICLHKIYLHNSSSSVLDTIHQNRVLNFGNGFLPFLY